LHREAAGAWREVVQLAPECDGEQNDLAWFLATAADPKLRDPPRAVEHAKKAVEHTQRYGTISGKFLHAAYCNTLGVAQYRAGDWKAAVEALETSIRKKSFPGRDGGDSADFFFLAMAHWQLGEKEQARQWYDRAVAWMAKNRPQDEELKRFRAEATNLLGIKDEPEAEPIPAPQDADRPPNN
jgi:tetratricopeptide (TPR) repeat protein